MMGKISKPVSFFEYFLANTEITLLKMKRQSIACVLTARNGNNIVPYDSEMPIDINGSSRPFSVLTELA